MRTSNAVRPALVLGCAFVGGAIVPAPTAADAIYALGRAELVMDPDPMTATVDPAQVFFEGSAMDVTVPVGLIEARRYSDEPDLMGCATTVTSTFAESHYVFQNPNATGVRNEAVLVFSGEILGIAHESGCRVDSDAYFARPGVSYRSGGLGLTPGEGDVIEIFPLRRTMFHRLVTLSADDWDGYRVITEAPPHDRIADVSLACTPFDGTVMAGDDVELTLTLSVPDGAASPDPQILFRPPSRATVTETDGPFDCAVEAEAAIQICALNTDPLPAGESAELRVVLHFDEAPMPVGRFVAFGSGAVRDPDLENNECDLRLVGPSLPDGAVPDGGVLPDGAVDAGALDAGASDAGRPPSRNASFRGAGGCECGVSTEGRDRRAALAFLLLVVGALAWRTRRLRR